MFRGAQFDSLKWGQARGPVDGMLGSRGRPDYEEDDESRYSTGSRRSRLDRRERNRNRSSERRSESREAEKKGADEDVGMKSLVMDFADRTSLQGVTHVFNPRSRNVVRAFWVIIFIAAIGATAYQFITVLNEYFEYKTTNVIKIGYGNLEYPSISLCNLNPIHFETLKRLKSKSEKVGKLFQFLDDIELPEKFSEEGSCRPPPQNPPPTSRPTGNNVDEGTTEDYMYGGTTEDNGDGGTMDDYMYGGTTEDTMDGGNTEETTNGVTTDGNTNGEMTDEQQTTKPGTTANGQRKKRNVDVIEARQALLEKCFCGYEDDECDELDLDVEDVEDVEDEDPGLWQEFMEEDDKDDDDDDDEDFPPPRPDHFGGGSQSKREEIQHLYQDLLAAIPTDQRRQLGHKARGFILDCEFNGRNCSYKNMTRFLDIDYGNCYTFNSADSLNTSLRTINSGIDNGLSLLLYLDAEQHISMIDRGNGIRLQIHPYNTIPFLRKTGLSVPAGFITYVGLKMKNVSRLGLPYHACNTSDSFKKDYNRNYTRDACLFLCPDRKVIQQCGCYRATVERALLPRTLVNDTHPGHVCSSANKITVNGKVVSEKKCEKQVMSNSRSPLAGCYCLDACSETNYDLLMSSSDWPGGQMLYALANAMCRVDRSGCELLVNLEDASQAEIEATLRRNFIFLKIYYRDLSFETNEEQAAYEDSQFLSDLGGTAGLYCGATLLTVVEIFSLFLNCCTLPGSKKNKPSSSETNQRRYVTYQQRW